MIIHGMAVANRGALRNPEPLDYDEKKKKELCYNIIKYDQMRSKRLHKLANNLTIKFRNND